MLQLLTKASHTFIRICLIRFWGFNFFCKVWRTGKFCQIWCAKSWAISYKILVWKLQVPSLSCLIVEKSLDNYLKRQGFPKTWAQKINDVLSNFRIFPATTSFCSFVGTNNVSNCGKHIFVPNTFKSVVPFFEKISFAVYSKQKKQTSFVATFSRF